MLNTLTDVLGTAYSREGNIQLAMGKDMLGQTQSNTSHGLPLGLVNGHRKSWLDWELTAPQLEGCVEVIGVKHNARQQDVVPSPWSCDHFSLYQSTVEAATPQAGAIGKAFHVVEIAQQHHWHAFFQEELMRRRARWDEGVQELHGVQVGLSSLLSRVSTEEVVCLHTVSIHQ